MPGNDKLREAFVSITQIVKNHYADADAADEPEVRRILQLIEYASHFGWLMTVSDDVTNAEEISRSVGIAQFALEGVGTETMDGAYRLTKGQQFRAVVDMIEQGVEARRKIGLERERLGPEGQARLEEQLAGLLMDASGARAGRQPDSETIRDVLRAVAQAKNSDEKWLAYVPLFAAMGFDLGTEGNEAENLRRLVERAKKS